MRNIIFRGKRLDNGEWETGSLIISMVCGIKHYHIQREGTAGYLYCFAVDPDTVGQYTGLKDRYGDRIWEGDLVEHGDEVSAVFFDTENSCFDFKTSNDPFAAQFSCDYEILGNIHDNPELIGGEDDG